MSTRIDLSDPVARERGFAASLAALRRGRLVALPLDWMYGLAADAFSQPGTDALRAAKARPDLTIPVMVPGIATVSGIARVAPPARALMEAFWPGALTLLLPAQPTLAWSLTDGAGRIAVRIPLHPAALELLGRCGPLGVVAAVPSGPQDATAVARALGDAVAVILDGGPLPTGDPSTVVDVSSGRPVLVRLGPHDLAELLSVCPDLVAPGGFAAGAAP